MKCFEKEGNVILENVEAFDIEEILECGQCFHFTKLSEKEYELINYGRYLHVSQIDKNVILYKTDMETYERVWKNYFDVERDYNDIKHKLIDIDDRLTTAIEAKPGIRILNQDFFETLISFIISQNKQIPHIKKIVHTLSDRYGSEVDVDGRIIKLFPTPEQLKDVSEDELRECKVGFRAPYIRDAVVKVVSGVIDENELRSIGAGECMKRLMSIKGVGEKVASCVMLFALGYRSTFPVDVWMKRIMEYMYYDSPAKKEDIVALASEKYGEYAGYAQQYLFYYGRENGIGK